ncbi:MAG: hypothetical protein NC248_05230 [Bacteroides sp.]|nr:hypothetical protein [Bacteroides sp.]MCM1389399.1 hypothetical protein [Bacteroides sp.]
MLKFGLVILFILYTCFSSAQTNFDGDNIRNDILKLQHENHKIAKRMHILAIEIDQQSQIIDSLKNDLASSKKDVYSLGDSLKINIFNNRTEFQTNSNKLTQSIKAKSQLIFLIYIIISLIITILAFIFVKAIAKQKKEIESLSAKVDKLNEEIVNRLSSEMGDIRVMSKQICGLTSASGSTFESEQRLIATLADRITFMEMTLYKMDSSVRGHKHLSKSIKQMKDNLLANGYELVEMLGKDYHDGMKVTANFVEDEELPQGKQIITGIIKPQINYNGKMIQSAQITVSQNI